MSPDPYAKGLTEFSEQAFEYTKNLTQFEYRGYSRHLGPKVLEVGAGWGRATKCVRERRPSDELVAVEPSPDLFLSLSRRLAGDAGVILFNCETAALQSRYNRHFDSVLLSHVIEHVENDRQLLLDSLKFLKEGGTCIILVPSPPALFSNFDQKIGHYRRYNKKMIREMIAGMDVQLKDIFYSNFMGILPFLFFVKFRKLDYDTDKNQEKAFPLLKLYDKFFVPIVAWIERYIPVPIGLSITVVLEKRSSSSTKSSDV